MTDITGRLPELSGKSESIVREAGEHILAQWKSLKTIDYKDMRDVVSNVDREVEDRVRQQLHGIFPEAGFIVEEGKSDVSARYNWVIDPIDGTKNYVHDLPLFYTQIALMDKDKPILAHVLNPVSRQLFSATLGGGTTLNGKKLATPPAVVFDQAIVEIDFRGKDSLLAWKTDVFKVLVQEAYRVRMTAGFMSPYMVTGAVDVSIKFCGNIMGKANKETSDLAPHIIIMSEAGIRTGFVHHPTSDYFLAAQPGLFDAVVSRLSSVS